MMDISDEGLGVIEAECAEYSPITKNEIVGVCIALVGIVGFIFMSWATGYFIHQSFWG